jgi:hypothetical protein
MTWLLKGLRMPHFVAGLLVGTTVMGGVIFSENAAFGLETDVAGPVATATPTPRATTQPSAGTNLPTSQATAVPGSSVAPSTSLPTAGTGGYFGDTFTGSSTGMMAVAAGFFVVALAILRTWHQVGATATPAQPPTRSRTSVTGPRRRPAAGFAASALVVGLTAAQAWRSMGKKRRRRTQR